MSICLCNLSADTVLELAARHELEVVPASPDPSSFLGNPDTAKEALGSTLELLPRPIELLLDNPNKRCRAKDVVYHVWRESLPKGGVLAIKENVYVSSPEFVLLQQANQLHQASLCQMLGRYLGTWTPVKDSPTGQKERAPLTSFEALEGFLSSLKSPKGSGNLRLAMTYTCEGAASAPETTLQLALSLPPRLHGLNLEPPMMNYEVDLSPRAQRLYPRQSIRIDLCWPDKNFGLEYSGKDHENQLGSDYARWYAAREEGYELWYVADEQLSDATQLRHIAQEVAQRLDLDENVDAWPTEGEFQDLLDILAGKKHQKPISYHDLHKRFPQR